MGRGVCADVTLSAWGRSLGLRGQVGNSESKGHDDPPCDRVLGVATYRGFIGGYMKHMRNSFREAAWQLRTCGDVLPFCPYSLSERKKKKAKWC